MYESAHNAFLQSPLEEISFISIFDDSMTRLKNKYWKKSGDIKKLIIIIIFTQY